jgi:hemin uptake protein HemP
LFKNQTALYIEHGNEMYVLRITKQGKLILTK